jgi:EAL domain-containing protein (putative c-di-GMP-specific phosphodiesterase class I)
MSREYLKNAEKGEILFREGERAGPAYIIVKGRVEISVTRDGSAVVLGTLGPNEILGEMAVIDQHRRTATATVLEDSVLSIITPEQIQQRISRADPVVRSLLNILLQRYRSELALEQGFTIENESALISSNAGIGKMFFENELRTALENEEVQVVYQPMRSLKGTLRNGFEALVRWDNRIHETISPARLVNLAEETDLIELLSLYVFRAAAEDLMEFKDASSDDLFLSVNVSPKHTVDSDFLNNAWDICAETGCRPGDIMLELTETVFVDIHRLSDWVDMAKAMGFLVSVDDFGTGFASLDYLTSLAPHTVKIDREFIRPIITESRHVIVLKKILEMARELDVLVIAEGAETYDHVRMLKEMGVDLVQGFEIDRPLTKFQTIDRLANWQPLLLYV